MTSLPQGPSEAVVANVDQRVILHGVSWEGYEAALAMRGDRGGTRIAYLEGELELMTPSRPHEYIKKNLARLLEAYAEEAGIELAGIGSWTLREKPKLRGVEPDECYVVGRLPIEDDDPAARPDLAIEVVWTSGGLDKLEIYRGLGVREVWQWHENAICVFVLESGAYRERKRSRLFPKLDLLLLSSFVLNDAPTSAVRAYRAKLRSQSKAKRR